MTKSDLIAFEREVAEAFQRGEIHAPIHLSGGNEDELIRIFEGIKPSDFVFSTWRSHYHALLKGMSHEQVMHQILTGRSMFLASIEHNFYASAIMGGCLSIACGVADMGQTVWCFVGDMCATTGTFADAVRFARTRGLDMHFVIEDNGMATNTPTRKAWGEGTIAADITRYTYKRAYPHYQPYGHLVGF